MSSARSVLNGVIGDYLEQTGNELATPMTLMRRPGQPLDCARLQQELLVRKQPGRTLPICILVHGLVSDEHCWTFPSSLVADTSTDNDSTTETTKKQKLDSSTTTSSSSNDNVDYGTLLERDIPGLTALYLRYNTGMHISTNGKRLNDLLEKLVVQLTTAAAAADSDKGNKLPPLEITLLCHSMGGLVARSATQYALRHAATWIYATSRIIFLGTPHHGSYWECAGNIVTCALDYVPLSATKVVAKVAKLRSHGIQDLRYGYTLEEDWKEKHQGQDSSDNNTTSWSRWIQDNHRQPGQAELLEWVSYHAVTGTIMADPQHPLNHILGDGLVSRASGEGRSAQPEYALTFASKREFPGFNHNALRNSREVYGQLLEWIATAAHLSLVPKFDWSTLPCRATTDRVMCNEQNDPECTDNGFVILVPNIEEESMIVVSDKKTCSSDDKQEPCVCFSINDGNSGKSAGRFAKYRGATSLVQDAVDGGVTAVEQVQTEITDDVYRAIKYVTPSVATPIVTGVQSIQTVIVAGIYSSIRYVNYGTAETVKMSFQTIDSVESVGSKMKWFLGYAGASSNASIR